MGWSDGLPPSQACGVTGRAHTQLREAVFEELNARKLWSTSRGPLAHALDIPFATAEEWRHYCDWSMDRLFWVIDRLRLPIDVSVSRVETDA
jgi:hypothetical protein